MVSDAFKQEHRDEREVFCVMEDLSPGCSRNYLDALARVANVRKGIAIDRHGYRLQPVLSFEDIERLYRETPGYKPHRAEG